VTDQRFVVRLYRPLNLDAVHLYIAEYRGRELFVAKPVALDFERREEGTTVEATLSFPSWIAKPFLEAFAEMLHQEKIRPQSQSFIEGELMATKGHLSDMRHLVLRGQKREKT